MTVGKYIKSLRTQHNYTQEELGNMLGVKGSAVHKWECGRVLNLRADTIKRMAEIFDVSPASFIVGESKEKSVPILGSIACGLPILAEENYDGEIPLPDYIHADYALRCKGDSMVDARIYDGDVVYIRQQSIVANGEIAAVLIGNEATLKKVYINEDGVTLAPCNKNYKPLIYSGARMSEVQIIGKAVGLVGLI